jgi:hypothetical protein
MSISISLSIWEDHILYLSNHAIVLNASTIHQGTPFPDFFIFNLLHRVVILDVQGRSDILNGQDG